MSWSAPADNGSAITDYDVQYRQTETTTWLDWAHTGTDTETTITGLTNGQTYEVQVRAENATGESAWSPSASLLVATVPGAPPFPQLRRGARHVDSNQMVAFPSSFPVNAIDTGGLPLLEGQVDIIGVRKTNITFLSGESINSPEENGGYYIHTTTLDGRYAAYEKGRTRVRNALGWGPWSVTRIVAEGPQ